MTEDQYRDAVRDATWAQFLTDIARDQWWHVAMPKEQEVLRAFWSAGFFLGWTAAREATEAGVAQ